MPHRLTRGVLLLAAWTAWCQAQEIAIFRPGDRTVVAPGVLVVAARAAAGAEVKLDGKRVAAAQPAPGAVTAALRIGPGRHELTVAAAGLERTVVFYAGPGGPADFKPFRAHPPAAGCETCHSVKEGTWSFRTDALGDTCFGCHEAKKFPEIHSHTPEVLAECTMCHSPHGSTEAKHLKLKKETACKQCHG